MIRFVRGCVGCYSRRFRSILWSNWHTLDASTSCVGRSSPFFGLLKSGYRVEKNRFDDAVKTAKLLVILSLIVMTLLDLKKNIGLTQGGYLENESCERLKRSTRELDSPEIDLSLRLFAFIARCGG